MQYNTQKGKLMLADYGRMVQEMVQHAITIEDRTERNRCAHTIVRVMGILTNLNPHKGEGQQKLWDHLAEIANYQLDVDYPVTITPQEERKSRPTPLPYPMKNIRARHYGSNVEAALECISNMPDTPRRAHMAGIIANQMKRLLAEQNRDSNTNERIINDIARYTSNRVTLPQNFRFANPNVRTTQGSNSLIGTKKQRKKK